MQKPEQGNRVRGRGLCGDQGLGFWGDPWNPLGFSSSLADGSSTTIEIIELLGWEGPGPAETAETVHGH